MLASGDVAVGSPWYALLSIAALVASSVIAGRWAGQDAKGEAGTRLAIVWLSALVGAFLGAKLAFLLAEGLAERTDTAALIGGRSISGALLGGYAAVELAKHLVGWRRTTGDLFAITVPFSLAIGRIGCVLAGCCQGVACPEAWYAAHDAHGAPRWPAAQAELLFNLAFLAWAVLAARFGWQRGQRFHLYLIAYGLFRFGHEFLRDDPRWFGPIGGYHAVAAATFAVGVWRYGVRRRAGEPQRIGAAPRVETDG